jgi:hypothetical protein
MPQSERVRCAPDALLSFSCSFLRLAVPRGRNAGFTLEGTIEGRFRFVADVDGRHEARQIVPPAFRDEAKVTLNKFAVEEIDAVLREHQP